MERSVSSVVEVTGDVYEQLEKLARFIVKESDEEKEMILDERLMLTPTIAVGESANFVTKMFTKVSNGLDKATDMLMNGYNSEDYEAIMENEEKIDSYEDHIGSYLMKLTTTQHLSEEDKNKSSKMLQAIGEFERIGDHARYIAKSAEELKLKGISFSQYAEAELTNLKYSIWDRNYVDRHF